MILRSTPRGPLGPPAPGPSGRIPDVPATRPAGPTGPSPSSRRPHAGAGGLLRTSSVICCPFRSVPPLPSRRLTERGGRAPPPYNQPCGYRPGLMGRAMSKEQTTVVVQRYLDELAGDAPAEPIVRGLLDRAVRRLHLLCA